MYIDAKLSVIRRRAVGNGFHEELTILNHDEKPVDLVVRIDAGCDFADLFEVKDALAKKGKYYAKVEPGRLRLGYQRERFTRETPISASAPARLDKSGLTFKVRIEPHGRLVDRPGRRHRVRRRRHLRTAEVRTRSAAGSAEHGAEPGEVDRGGAASSNATRTSSGRPTGAASSISPRFASRRPSPVAEAFLRPACPGS